GGPAPRPRLRCPHLPRAAAGHPRAARRALGGIEAGRGLPTLPSRRPPGPSDDRAGGSAGLQADDRARVRDPLEQLRLLLRRLRRARAAAPGAQGGGARPLRLAAAPALREPRVRLEPGPCARDQRQPRVRGVLPGLPDRRLTSLEPLDPGAAVGIEIDHGTEVALRDRLLDLARPLRARVVRLHPGLYSDRLARARVVARVAADDGARRMTRV